MPPVVLLCADVWLGQLLTQYLTDAGYPVVPLDQLDQALAHLRQHPASLLLYELSATRWPPPLHDFLEAFLALPPTHILLLVWFGEIIIPAPDRQHMRPPRVHFIHKPLQIERWEDALQQATRAAQTAPLADQPDPSAAGEDEAVPPHEV